MISLTASGDASDTYSWTGPNSFTSSAQNPTIANATPANAGDYTVTRTTACGTSPPSTTTVTVNPIPNSTITASSSGLRQLHWQHGFCAGCGRGRFLWLDDQRRQITAGSTTNSITYTANASGTSFWAARSPTVPVATPMPSSVNGDHQSSARLRSSRRRVPLTQARPTTRLPCRTRARARLMRGRSAAAPSPPVRRTHSITYTAGASGTLTLGCTVTNSSGCVQRRQRQRHGSSGIHHAQSGGSSPGRWLGGFDFRRHAGVCG